MSRETEWESRKQMCVLSTWNLPALVLTAGLAPVSGWHGLFALETTHSSESLQGKALAESVLVTNCRMAWYFFSVVLRQFHIAADCTEQPGVYNIRSIKCTVSREGVTQAFMVVQPEIILGKAMSFSSRDT